MNTPITRKIVIKRNGEKEQLDLNKVHKVLFWATEDITGVSVSDVEMKAGLHLYDGITTSDVQQILVKAAANLISLETPNYQYVAARLAMFDLRKKVLGHFNPKPLYDIIIDNVEREVYDGKILHNYNKEQIEKLDSFIKHDRDYDFAYAGIQQVMDKYLVQDRSTGETYETPQYMYIMIAATIFAKYPDETRMKYVKDYYDAISTFKLSLPTPIMAGVRTPLRQFSSCVLIDVDDNLDSLIASNGAVTKYIAKRAGIGLNFGRVRALGSAVRGGEVKHTGVIPFLQWYQSAIKSCSQGGIRDGAGTVHFPFWHREIEDIIVLKNNKGGDDNRCRKMDYSIQLNKLFYERFLKNENITLFSPHDAPDLYQAFFADQELFNHLYTVYEKKYKIEKKVVKARELFSDIMLERAETGRIYLMNVDHCNTHSSFDDTIYMSNLCQEITLPTDPFTELNNPDDLESEIALCILSAVNLGSIKDLGDLELLCDLAVRALDELIDYQEYPMQAAKNATLNRRSLGIGVINYAYYLAKNKAKYNSQEAYDLTHELFEAIQYNLIKASANLAKEKGPCPYYNRTKYSRGIMPIDTYKSTIEQYTTVDYKLDWVALRELVSEHGLRNSTLSSLMPSESSSQVSNGTNGIEPPRGYISNKKCKNTMAKMVVPEYAKLKNFYDLAWDHPSNEGYLINVGIMQKFVDQAISANTYYNPERFDKGEIPMSLMMKEVIMAYQLGVKTLYYHNTFDGKSDDEVVDDGGCAGGACAI